MNFSIIFETLAGSHLYGTSTPDSDMDSRGVCVVPINDMLDPFQNFEQFEDNVEKDRTIFNLPKFFQLASKANPNIIELLYAPKESLVTLTSQGKLLLDNVTLFASQLARQTFIGYSYSQLKRINLHREWLLNPPSKKPLRKDFGLPEMSHFGLERIDNLIHAPVDTIKDEWREYALAEQSYRSAKQYWDNYENWMKNRNPKRFEIEKKYGFDSKHALHLYRLLTEGLEFLTTGRIIFPRPDRGVLLDIRNGVYSYDELMKMTSDFEDKINNVQSSLPKKPNINKLKELYYEILKDTELKNDNLHRK